MFFFSGNEKEQERVPFSKNKGPHGLGDPDDRSLRVIEKEVIIPKRLRREARETVCTFAVEEFNKCYSQHSITFPFICQKENKILKSCILEHITNEESIKQCTEEYLNERSNYRRTGQNPNWKPRRFHA